MIKFRQKQGMVLVIGLIYITIAMLSCFSTLENVGVLALEQAGSIQSYKNFYFLEYKVARIEKQLIGHSFSENKFSEILVEQNIIDIQDKSTKKMIELCPDYAPEKSYLTSLAGEGN